MCEGMPDQSSAGKVVLHVQVVATDVDIDRLNELYAEEKRIMVVRMDVTDPEEVDRVVTRVGIMHAQHVCSSILSMVQAG